MTGGIYLAAICAPGYIEPVVPPFFAGVVPMIGSSYFTRFASLALVLTAAAAASAEPLTIDKAQELSRQTGRPILAVAGTKT